MATADTTERAIYRDEAVAESMHAMLAVLNDWERVCAAEEIDLDAMDEVDERFAGALKQLIGALGNVPPRDTRPPIIQWIEKNGIGTAERCGSSWIVRSDDRAE